MVASDPPWLMLKRRFHSLAAQPSALQNCATKLEKAPAGSRNYSHSVPSAKCFRDSPECRVLSLSILTSPFSSPFSQHLSRIQYGYQNDCELK